MHRRLYVHVVALLGFWGVIDGTAFGDQQFPIVQVCLGNEQELPVFLIMMRSIARSENMKFIDGSEQTREDLDSIGAVIHGVKPTGSIVNVGVEREDGMGLTVGNLGLPKDQVAIGFSKGHSLPEAQEFVETVVGRLKARWHVEVLPIHEAVRGMQTCSE